MQEAFWGRAWGEESLLPEQAVTAEQEEPGDAQLRGLSIPQGTAQVGSQERELLQDQGSEARLPQVSRHLAASLPAAADCGARAPP